MALDEIRKVKIEKLEKLRKAGIDPYPASTRRSMSVAEAVQNFDKLSEAKDEVILAGRMMARREHGGSIFFDMDDGSGRIQGFIKEDVVGAEMFERFRDLFDTGDIIEVAGHLFKTKKEERTVEVKHCVILSKALLPLPEKWHGLTDVEERFRKRYLDLALNEDIRQTFKTRAVVIKALRDFLNEHDFLEVSTPTLQPLYGGASARPFKTHMHALDVDLFLRVAPELYLKRLLVGGFEKVFEFTTNFRNEGMDREHNPEFSAVEFYAAYKDYNWSMELIEDLMVTLDPVRFKKPFKRLTYAELMQDRAGVDVHDVDPAKLDEVFKEKIRGSLIDPTFVYEFPKSMFPLAKLKDGSDDTVEVFQFYTGGLELVKAFTELNDPGDEEAQRMDDDYIEAMEYGMPPNSGVGIGLDRLIALLTDSHSIREVILFPLMKPRDN